MSAILPGLLRAQYEQAPPSPGEPNQAPADPDQVSFQTFYDSLASQGTWIQNSDYGYIWQPSVSDPNWAPYTVGHWVYTEDGWTWVSDEPWGWATYHYGRWVNLDGTGWCWVPGYTWAPAWVSWRYGDGYCGWAPLPPDSMVGVDYSGDDNGDIGFHIGGDCDSYYGIGPGWYNFLPDVYLGDEDYRGFYANRYNNYRIINRTTNVTNLNVTRGGGGEGNGIFAGVSLGGPSFLAANSGSQSPIQRADLAFTPRVGGGEVSGNTLSIFAPRVESRGSQAERPGAIAQSIGHVNVNRGTNVSQPMLVTSRLGVASPTAQQVQRAQFAQSSAPASANVATMNTPVRSGFATPFTAMRPLAPATEATGMRALQTYPGGQDYRPSSPTYATQRTYSSGGVYRSPGGAARAAPSGGGGIRGGGVRGGGGYQGGR